MNETRYYKYYFFLLVILCTWFSTIVAPPMPIRLAYLVALIIPAYLYAPYLLVPVLACFTSVAAYGFSCSYMPTELHYYLIIMFLLLGFGLQKNLKTQRPSVLFTCFCLYVLCIDLLKGGELENIDYSILVVLISYFFVSKDGHEESSYILSFIMVSLIICLYFFTYGQGGTVEVSEDGRTAWKDPNYLGNVCGMGIVLAYNVLVNNLYTNKKIKHLCLLTVIVGVIMIVINASRGAFLSMTVAITIITLFAKIKTSSKFGIVIAVSLSVVTMYSLGLFEVLEERVMSDDGTGNARTIIWTAKLDAYSQLSLLEKVFGSGYRRGFELAIPGGFGFHSDYIAWLVDYGIVGLLFFISLLIYPLKLVWNRQSQRPIVLSLILFLATCCSTLEPLTAGRLAYWYFYMLIVLFARWSSQQSN